MKKTLIIFIILNSVCVIASIYLKYYDVILVNVFGLIVCVWALIKEVQE